MSHRIDRLASVVREVVSEAITSRLSDPRVNRLTSVTRVHVAPDLTQADVHVSVMGTPSEERLTLAGLQSAAGLINGMLAGRLSMWRIPAVRFHLDAGIKKGTEIIQELDRLKAERIARGAEAPAPAEPETRPHE